MSTTNGGPQARWPCRRLASSCNTQRIFHSKIQCARVRSRPARSSRPLTSKSMSDAAPMSETDFEVTLRLEGKAESQGLLLYGFELVFAGVFRIMNVPADSLQPFVLIECPACCFRSRGRLSPRRCATAAFSRCC